MISDNITKVEIAEKQTTPKARSAGANVRSTVTQSVKLGYTCLKFGAKVAGAFVVGVVRGK
jgi:hypothetical protein